MEQLEADKERASDIYTTYQKDIIKLKLLVNENYEKASGRVSRDRKESKPFSINRMQDFKTHLSKTVGGNLGLIKT